MADITYLNEPDPNVSRIMGEFTDPVWWQSKFRQSLEDGVCKWARDAASDGGLNDVRVMTNGHGMEVWVRGSKGNKTYAGRFYFNASVMADIWNWAKAL